MAKNGPKQHNKVILCPKAKKPRLKAKALHRSYISRPPQRAASSNYHDNTRGIIMIYTPLHNQSQTDMPSTNSMINPAQRAKSVREKKFIEARQIRKRYHFNFFCLLCFVKMLKLSYTFKIQVSQVRMFEWGRVFSKNPGKHNFLLEIFPDNQLYNIQVLRCLILK